jgi:hypothetical protein
MKLESAIAMKDDIIRKKDVNTVKGILWGNSNKIKRFPTDISVYTLPNVDIFRANICMAIRSDDTQCPS